MGVGAIMTGVEACLKGCTGTERVCPTARGVPIGVPGSLVPVVGCVVGGVGRGGLNNDCADSPSAAGAWAVTASSVLDLTGSAAVA